MHFKDLQIQKFFLVLAAVFLLVQFFNVRTACPRVKVCVVAAMAISDC